MKTALILAITAAFMTFTGCSKEEEDTAGYTPREAPSFSNTPVTQPTAATAPADTAAGLPPGHPPIPSRMGDSPHGMGAVSPHGVGGMSSHATGTAPADEEIVFEAPKGWVGKPARPMTEQVFAAPKVESDAADADVAISTLGTASIPLQMNVERWCTQFELPAGKNCQEASKTEPVAGAKLPTNLVEISGAFRGGGAMMGPSGPAKPGYKMLAAEIRTPGQLWFVKMVGPEKTVEHWRSALVDMVRTARVKD